MGFYPIRGPSVQRMVKELRIPKPAAVKIKDAMQAGKAQTALRIADKAMNGHGVECLYHEFPNFYYVNTGDTYDTTLYYTGNSFQIGDWGGYVERNERKRRESW